MKTVVIYTSKRGSTKKYAEWIGEELKCDVIEYNKDCLDKLNAYEQIIYGGWVRGGGIVGLDKLRKNYKYIDGKKLMVFAVGLSIDNKENYIQLREINFKAPLNLAPLFVLPGAFDPEKLTGVDKMIIGILKKVIGGKKNNDSKGENESEQQIMMESLEKGVDLVDKSKINQILDAARD
jgi:menaquinone-dependent protoporphyrinogen IX oxidase